MITSVSNSAQFQNIDKTPLVVVKPQAKLLPSATPAADSVKLSAKAEAAALQQRGFTVGEIAANLDVTPQTIDGYLRLNTTSGTAAVSAAAAAASESKAAAKASSTNATQTPLQSETATHTTSSSTSSSNPASKSTEPDSVNSIYKPASESASQQLAHS